MNMNIQGKLKLIELSSVCVYPSCWYKAICEELGVELHM
jgi:hypothetical protein